MQSLVFNGSENTGSAFHENDVKNKTYNDVIRKVFYRNFNEFCLQKRERT